MSDFAALLITIFGLALVVLNTIYMIDALKKLERKKKLHAEQLKRVLKVLRKEDDE